jgi:hypothetical protein
MADFFPTRDIALLEWLKNFSAVLSQHGQAWGIPAHILTDLTGKMSVYETVFESAIGENGTKALVVEKNGKRKALKAEVRNIKNKHIDYNDLIEDADRERLGLPIRDHTHTSKPRPASRPILEVLPTNHRQHTASAINQNTGKKTKPSDAYGVRYGSEIRDEPPDRAEDLRYSVFRRKTSEVYDYPESDRGKKVFYAACYENSKGESGPWSDIIEAVIP